MENTDLSTQRLIIRRFTLDDAEEMFDLASDPAIGRMAGWPPHSTIDDSIDFIEKGMDREDLYGLFSRTTRRMIGCIELFREPNILKKGPKDAEIGYWIGSRYWNQGYATEALGRLLEYAAATGVPKVWAQCLTNNPASARVLIKCGFKLDHRSLSENPMLGKVIVDFYSLSLRRRARRCPVLFEQERRVIRQRDLTVNVPDVILTELDALIHFEDIWSGQYVGCRFRLALGHRLRLPVEHLLKNLPSEHHMRMFLNAYYIFQTIKTY